MTENEISWDLSEIYKGTEDPKIEESIKNLKLVVEDFVKNYKGKIQAPEFTANDLLELFQKIEEFEAALDEIVLFSSLLFAANMKISESEALKSKVERIATEMGKSLAFLDLEIGKYVHEKEDLINHPILDNYKHHLETIRRRYPHLLSEVEEQLILEKDENGIRQWSQLQGKWLNTKEFKVNVEGEEKILSYGEANSLLRHRDRDTRISAEKSIYSTLGKDETIFSMALRNICEDWVKTVKRRNFIAF